MADNIPHIRLAQNEWTDIYSALAAHGVVIGDPLLIENVGSADVYLAVQAAQPTPGHDAYNVLKKGDPILMGNTVADVGAWAFCNSAEGLLAVSTTSPNGFVRMLKVLLADGYGNPLESFRGAINIHDSCVHRAAFNHFLHYDTATATTPAAPVAAGSSQITFTSVVGFAVGDDIKITNGSVEPTFFVIVALAGNVVTLDRPVTFAHDVTSTIRLIYTNLAQPGLTAAATPLSPVVFTSHIPVGTTVHITNLSVIMTDTAAMDFTSFGGITGGVVNGVVLLAQTDGLVINYTNWKQNLDLDSDAFPVRYQTKTGGGEYGLSATYNIKESTEAVVYLDGTKGDYFNIRIQDDLTSITNFKVKLQGHYEGI